MRKWGIVISAFYAIILLGILVPSGVLLAGPSSGSDFLRSLGGVYREWFWWVPLGILLFSQASLLFVSVDTSKRRLKPRAHVLVSCAIASVLTALLSLAVIWSLMAAVRSDKFDLTITNTNLDAFIWLGAFWLPWLIFFYLYLRNSSAVVTRVISWLLKGSVLELLVAVPSHVIVRRRQDCSAPILTSFGIVTGIAIMLLSFGPSVLFLYKKRLNAYASRPTT